MLGSEAKMSNWLHKENEALESEFPQLHTFSESVELLSSNRDANLTQNEHVYSTCCRPEVASNVISSGNVKTIEGYAELKFQAAGFSIFRENQKQPFA